MPHAASRDQRVVRSREAASGDSQSSRMPRRPSSRFLQRIRRAIDPPDFPILPDHTSTASRWSISTTARRRKSRARSSTPIDRYYETENANIHRGVYQLSQIATDAYEQTRTNDRAIHQRRRRPRSHLHPRHDRRRSTSSLQSSAARILQAGRRDHRLGDGAPLQHRPLADRRRGRPAQRFASFR